MSPRNKAFIFPILPAAECGTISTFGFGSCHVVQHSSAQLGFNPSVHGLRGIAALAVLLFHWGFDIGFFPEARRSWVVSEWDFGFALDYGWLGVPLFFVLSGYLLTAQLQRRELTRLVVGRFWLARRIT